MTAQPNIIELYADEYGLNETYQEIHKAPLTFTFCDAIYLSNPKKNREIASEFEKIIKKYLILHRNDFNEKILIRAIDHAQNYFFLKYASRQKQLKISALIMIQPPHLFGQPICNNLFILAVGDIKAYHINETKPELISYDPETPLLPSDLTPLQRFQYITNAIGNPNLKKKVFKIDNIKTTQLAILTYGYYHRTPTHKFLEYILDFENKKNLLIKSITDSHDRDHSTYLSFILLKNHTQQHTLKRKPQSNLYSNRNKEVSQKKHRFFHSYFYKSALIICSFILIVELYHHHSFSIFKSNPNFQKNHYELELDLNRPAPKKVFQFPYLKERKTLMNLKEKNFKQNQLIEKLNRRLREQSQVLRDFQIKLYSSNEIKHTQEPQNLKRQKDPFFLLSPQPDQPL